MAYVACPSIFKRFTDDNGVPLSGGKIYTYKSKTNDLKNTYKDAEGLAKNTNPIILDAGGFCRIFLEANTADNEPDSSAYRFDIYDKNDVLIYTEDDIFPINGVDGKNTGTIVVGPVGFDGDPGRSIKGNLGPIGKTGSIGKNGQVSEFYRVSGTYTKIVDDDVTSMDIIVGGAGGGIYVEQALPDVGQVATGLAGEIVKTTFPVVPGETITIVVGKGGQASTDQNAANGKASSVSTDNLTVTAKGGTSGNTVNISPSQSYFDRMMEPITIEMFGGQQLNIIPRAIYGESTIFGQGGNVYRGSSNAVGNCASGGSGEPYIGTDGKLKIASFGNGGDGYVQLSWIKPNDEETD